MTTLTRAYKGKDAEMLTACSTITDHAIDHKTYLVSKRSTWADPFFPDLKARISNAFPEYLGIDNATELRQATQALLGIQKNTMQDLAEFKVQIMEDFKNNPPRRDEILNLLGFSQHLKEVQRYSQEALVELLSKFKKNMSNQLKTEITSAGTSVSIITAITGYADVLKNSNITQETFKASRKEITASAVNEFNEIYTAVISVAKISAKFFKDNKAVQDKFSYTRTLNALNHSGSNGKNPPPPPTSWHTAFRLESENRFKPLETHFKALEIDFKLLEAHFKASEIDFKPP